MDLQAKTIAIVGRNASGKTRHAQQLRRMMATDSVRYMAFCDTYGTQTDRAYYLQQRWNQHDIDTETPTVGQSLERAYQLTGADTPERQALRRRLTSMLGLDRLLDQYVIALSSGELRKLQVTKTLLANPRTLILDSPFIGLDAEARLQLSELLRFLSQEGDLQVVLLLAREEEIPDWVEETEWMTPREEFCAPVPAFDGRELLGGLGRTESQPGAGLGDPASCVVEMRHVTVSYNGRTILGPVDWTIRQGECWALSGRNGSGKSTLLSLISADNPQGYACDISLFGRQRGSGESIWDIKRRIGYVSPEMHRSYQRPLPALQVVASGLKDTVGLYVRPTAEEREICRRWMDVFGVGHLAERSFLTLSGGEQRMVLLARAFVKSPDLLILDEPLHGLDAPNSQRAKSIIDTYCRLPGKTLLMVTHYEHELPPCITHHKRL